MNLIKKSLALREGGQTQRCHTMQYIGPYNVAIHSYNALSLLLLLYPTKPPSVNLIKAVLWHDVPERWTGDVPSPAKIASITLKEALKRIEYRILYKLGMAEIFHNLTLEEEQWLNGVDLLELFMWTQEQVAMGNGSVNGMNDQIEKIFNARWDTIPTEVRNFYQEFEWSRTDECVELLGGSYEQEES